MLLQRLIFLLILGDQSDKVGCGCVAYGYPNNSKIVIRIVFYLVKQFVGIVHFKVILFVHDEIPLFL